MTRRTIDLNCDMGERSPHCPIDAALLEIVTSANIACGGHAGDDETIRATVKGALARGVAIGAHPGYPDRASFGRVSMKLSDTELRRTVVEQVRGVRHIARELGGTLAHVKPHGALYHDAMNDAHIAGLFAEACREVDAAVVLIGQAGASALDWWKSAGFRTASEAFGDRRYEPDGKLRSRNLDGALIADPADAAKQAVSIAGFATVQTRGGALAVCADTICIHSDTPEAIAVARAVRDALAASGISVAAT